MKLILNLYNRFVNDSLFKNSFYLILSTAVTAVLGFFFWIVNARLFTVEQVGIGTTLISIMGLLSSFCLLGLGGSLVKYLPSSTKKSEKINTAFSLISTASLLVSLVYLLFLHKFSPKLLFVRENQIFSVLFILFVIFNSLNTITQNVFVAFRSTIYVLIKNTVLSLSKLAFPFLVVSIGAYGVFVSVGAPTALAFFVSLYFLYSKFGLVYRFQISKEVVRKIFKFSAANYFMGFISLLPTQILPVIITNNIGPEYSAYYYMDMMIANFIYIIPMATSQSLFAEGSYNDKELSGLTKKASKIIFLLLVPAISGVLIFGRFVLMTFGNNYSDEGIVLLQLFSVSSVFIAVNYLGNAVFYIKQRIREVILLNTVSSAAIIGLSYLFIGKSLYGIGWAWVLGNALISLYYLPPIIRRNI